MNREPTYKLYLDDSGDKKYEASGEYGEDTASRFFVLGGILVPINLVTPILSKALNLKMKYFINETVEIKSTWIRIPTQQKSHYLDKYEISKKDFKEFVEAFTSFQLDPKVKLVGAVVDKKEMQDRFDDPWPVIDLALEGLMQRVQNYMEKENNYCSFTMDIMGSQKETNSIRQKHKEIVESNGKIVSFDMGNVAPRLNFTDSKGNSLIQLADLCAYNIHRQYRGQGTPFGSEHSNIYPFLETTLSNFIVDAEGLIEGYGITKIPFDRRPAWHK